MGLKRHGVCFIVLLAVLQADLAQAACASPCADGSADASFYRGCYNNGNVENEVGDWNVACITSMQEVFTGATFGSTSVDLSKWNTHKVTDM